LGDTPRRIPIIDEIAAGNETPVCDEDIMGEIWWTGEEFQLDRQALHVEFLRGSQIKFSAEYDYVAVQVSGDSMDRAGIASGDYVILQKTNLVTIRPASGDIVAIVFRDEADNRATLKRIQIQSDRVILKPESLNPEHQPRTLPPQAFAGDQPRVAVIGIALAVLKPGVQF
jgi:SOS-response transcriptional repressor LexA